MVPANGQYTFRLLTFDHGVPPPPKKKKKKAGTIEFVDISKCICDLLWRNRVQVATVEWLILVLHLVQINTAVY